VDSPSSADTLVTGQTGWSHGEGQESG